jgi:hypothetical protein
VNTVIEYEAIGADDTLIKITQKEFIRWYVYSPTTLADEFPLGEKWWSICYWIDLERKNIYELLLKTNVPTVERYLFETLGVDEDYFRRHFGKFMKRLKNMEKAKLVNHLGESKHG